MFWLLMHCLCLCHLNLSGVSSHVWLALQASCAHSAAAGGCNVLLPVVHGLGAPPRVFTLQLAWESHHEEPQHIAATLAAVDERVRPPGISAVLRSAHSGKP